MRMTFLALAALALAACASSSQETAGRDCFRSANVTGFNVVDRNTIQVQVGASRRYLLTTNWPTSNLDFSQRIAIRSTTGLVCTGNGLGVDVVGGEPPMTFPIHAIARAPEPAGQG